MWADILINHLNWLTIIRRKLCQTKEKKSHKKSRVKKKDLKEVMSQLKDQELVAQAEAAPEKWIAKNPSFLVVPIYTRVWIGTHVIKLPHFYLVPAVN